MRTMPTPFETPPSALSSPLSPAVPRPPPLNATGAPLVVVFNVGAGHGEAQTVRETLQQGCADAGRALQLMAVDDPRRLGTIARQAVQAAQACGGVVVAAGGDGTINTVAQAVLSSGCTFGVLPQGTFNYFSRTHGIPADTAGALQVLLDGACQPVQVGLVGEQVFLVNASLGLYPQLLEDRESWKQQLGRSRLVAFGAGLSTLLRGHRSLRLQIDAKENSEVIELRTPTLFVGNNALQMEQLGFAEADAIDAGQLAVLALRPVGTARMLALLLRGALGRLGEADDLVRLSSRRLTVSAQGMGGRQIKVATDGEVRWMKLPLTFRVSPQPLWLLRPAAPAPERVAAAAA